MHKLPIVVMVSGRAGEGKTTFSDLCITYLGGLGRPACSVSFAGGVKDTARFMGWDSIKDDAGRRLLQQVGNIGREYDKDIWAKKAMKEILESDCDVVFIDDWRFPNEGNVIIKNFADVEMIRVCRAEEFHTLNGTELYDDISEISLPDVESDFYNHIVDNIGSIDELNTMAIEFSEKRIVPQLVQNGGIE